MGSVCFLFGVLLCNCVHGACFCTKWSPNDSKYVKNEHKNRKKSTQCFFSSVLGRELRKSGPQVALRSIPGPTGRWGDRPFGDPLGPKCCPKGRFGSPWRPKMAPKTDLPPPYWHFGCQKVLFWRVLEKYLKSIKF